MRFATLSAEPDGDQVRIETHAGRKHLVAPVVMVREGVLNEGFLPFDAIEESIPGWNGRPVTAPPDANASGHPVDDDGEFVSANQAEYLESMRVGFIQAAEAVEDLPAANADDDRDGFSQKGARAEVWVDLAAVESVGDMAVEAARRIAEGDALEVSTGYFHKLVDRRGSFNGATYTHEQFGLIPDHLALLPNEDGACSWADGCGTPRVNFATMTVNQEDGDRVRWESDGEPRYGIIVDDQEGEAVDEVLVAVYAWDGDEWVRGDDTVNLSTDTFEVIDQFPPEPAEDAANAAAELAAAADADDPKTLSQRATHAVHVLTGNADSCSCPTGGGDTGTDTNTDSDTTDMTDHDLSALADALGIATETLESMDEDEVESLADAVDTEGDDGDADDDGQANADDDTDEVKALREQVESLTDEIQDLKAQQNRDPRVERARAFLVDNTDHDEDALADWPDTAVIETAQARGFRTHEAPRGDRVNRLGAGGPAAANGQDDDTEEYVANAGAFNQLESQEGDD